MTTLSGSILVPESPGQCGVMPDSSVRIEGSRIAQVGGTPSSGAVVGGPGCWILPGFVDAHLHLPQWDRRGIDGLSVFEWRSRIGYPAEARLSDTRIATLLAEELVSGVLACGTTTIAAFGSPFPGEVDASFEVFRQRGIRAIYGLTLGDIDMPEELAHQPDKALDDARSLAAKWHGQADGRLMYAFSPRTSINCSERLLRGAGALADMLKCYLQTHVADCAEERQAVRQRFPDQIDEIDLFMEFGMLGKRTLLAHGAFLDHQHRRELAESNTAVVHCPTAYLFRECGLMDYVQRRSNGIRTALGSSIAGGFEPFMPRVAVEGLQMAKAIKVHSIPRRAAGGSGSATPAEAWWLLTAGGAAALGLEEHIGRVAAGFQADLLVVRPEKWIADLPAEQQISALLYTLTPGQIQDVFVGGRRVGP